MLKFARNKLINTYWKTPDILMVHGVLDDDIYSLEVNAEIQLPELVFANVMGKWHRYTTPECPRSLNYIEEADGLKIDDAEIEQKLQKGLGRSGCRHFATLLIECVKSVKETLHILEWKNAVKKHQELTFEEYIKNPDLYRSAESVSMQIGNQDRKSGPADTEAEADDLELPKPSGGFVIDLHTHSFPASKCAADSVDQMIQEAKKIGLDGICLTDHNFCWDKKEINALCRKHDFLILRGTEVSTDQGHMVVFGLDHLPEKTGIIKLEDLHQWVKAADGFMIAAHPFRGFLTFGVGKLGLTVDKAAGRPLFELVDAIEILNGKVTLEENGFASKVAARLNLPNSGGSDSHAKSEVGCYATEFENPIHDETELISALKNGQFRAVSLRGVFEKEKTV